MCETSVFNYITNIDYKYVTDFKTRLICVIVSQILLQQNELLTVDEHSF